MTLRHTLVAVVLAAATVPAGPGHAAPEGPYPVLTAGTVAGAVWQREAPEGVLVLDTVFVQDGNMMISGEDPAALERRRTFLVTLGVRCDLAARTCELVNPELRQIPVGSFVYDAVRGEARLHVKLGKKHALDVYFAPADGRPGVIRPGAGFDQTGDFVVTGGVAVSRPTVATGNLYGIEAGGGVGAVITGVLQNVYVTPPVGPAISVSKLFG